MPHTAKHPIRIVLIEDDQSISFMYATRFQQAGFEVHQAANGADGLELVESIKPDIVLLDIMMPKMNGYEVLESIKKSTDPEIQSIPVMLLTNLAEDAGFDKGKELGADEYVVKANRTPDELVHLINAIIQTNRGHSQ